MDLPAIVRSAHTWDTSGPGDLRQDEEAIVVQACPSIVGIEGWSSWILIPIERPRLVKLHVRGSIETVLRKWLIPA